MWTFDLGDTASTGCFFHVQVLADATHRQQCTYFPSTLDIPRLPGLLFTPADALDFALGELFQSGWPDHVIQAGADGGAWRALQLQRLEAVLAWQRQELANSIGSPWAHLKAQKPHVALLVPEDAG